MLIGKKVTLTHNKIYLKHNFEKCFAFVIYVL